jgi:hypothetical protein
VAFLRGCDPHSALCARVARENKVPRAHPLRAAQDLPRGGSELGVSHKTVSKATPDVG